MKICEIFQSISGEASGAGLPSIFIRTFGCNLRCTYCDSKYSYNGDQYMIMEPEDILKHISNYKCKRVVFTGGEPLLQTDANVLVDLLADNEYIVEIETNGAINLGKFHSKLQTKRKDLIYYTMDYKSPSSGENLRMDNKNLEFLTYRDVIKFVVGSKHDLLVMKDLLREHPYLKAQVYVSPVFGQIEPKEIVEFILENELNECRLQIQLHKVIWDFEERGV